MTTLRVLHAQAPSPAREVAWALFDTDGVCIRNGAALASDLPHADRVEAIVAASRVRFASVALPPMATSRVANAARFALEDQLASPPETQQLAVSAQRPDGRVRVAIVDRALLQSIATGAGPVARPARIVAEPDLAPATAAWRWCGSDEQGGFVRCSDGSAFAVDRPAADGSLPSELALALAHAARSGAAPEHVQVDAPFGDALLARWQRETGIAFRRGVPWRWYAASPAAFAAALELLPSVDTPARVASRPGHARLFANALWIAVAALALHVVATMGDWAWLKFDAWRNAREWTALAIAAGVAPESATTPSSARAALARRHAELRHLHGQLAPNDALPLLARAAPALATLPPGAVKSATFADFHWTLDLARADAAVLAELDSRLRQSDVPALTAATPASTRIRLGAP